jgi:5-methylcytosine-specific restriction endonuclease McrA
MPFKDINAKRKCDREWKRKQREQNRLKVIEMLGGKCVQCGETDSIVLEIDHIIPLNHNNRKGEHGINLMMKILAVKLPLKDVQILCSNDNTRKTYYERYGYNGYILE